MNNIEDFILRSLLGIVLSSFITGFCLGVYMLILFAPELAVTAVGIIISGVCIGRFLPKQSENIDCDFMKEDIE